MLPRGAFIDDFNGTPDLYDVLEFAENTGRGYGGPPDGDDSGLSPVQHCTYDPSRTTEMALEILARRRFERSRKVRKIVP